MKDLPKGKPSLFGITGGFPPSNSSNLLVGEQNLFSGTVVFTPFGNLINPACVLRLLGLGSKGLNNFFILEPTVVLAQILQRFKQDFEKDLQSKSYILADTRVRGVSLYDHLRLTAGFAAAMVCELRNRGLSSTTICGEKIEDDELLPLARLCGWLHDIGKPSLQHDQRSVELSKNWLSKQEIREPYLSLITEAVFRHHLRNNPRTPLEKIICLADIYASAGDRPELKGAYLETQQMIETLERELFGEDKPICLLLGDVDAIKDFVYEGTRLTEIRGGSILLSEIDGEEKGQIVELFRKQELEECLIYCGGGSFLAILPASEAEKWKEKIEKLYLDQTKTATITVVASSPLGYAEIGQGLPPRDPSSVEQLDGKGVASDLIFSHLDALNVEKRVERKNFGELVADLVARLRLAKLKKEHFPFLPALPVHKRCQSCGKRAAEKFESITGEWLCSICFQKREKGREGRGEFFWKFEDWIQKKGIERLGKKPEDFEALAGPDGRIAFIHADGNNVGDLLQIAKTPAHYRHISEALNVSVTDALFSALVDTIGEENLSETLPFEIVVVGGDEAMVVVRARYGWRLTLKLLENFERHSKIRKLREELGRKITLSAGILFADVKYPARFMYNMVEDLLKEAKRFSRQRGGESALCHLWLRSPSVSENVRNTLDGLYRREIRGEVRYLTSRPFTLEQAKRLTELAQELRSLPSHQRRIIAEALEKGVWTSLNIALYQVQRSKRGELLQTFKELGKLIQEKNFQDGFFFWQQLEGEWRTALLDALELIELNCVGP